MKHLILTQPYAEQLSASIYLLGRPAEVQKGNEVSRYYSGWHVHEDGREALDIPDDSRLIHPDADIASFVALVADTDVTVTTTDEEGVETTEVMTMEEFLESRRGSKVNILSLIESTVFAPNLRTKEQMEADGWFPQQEDTL